MLSLSSYGAWTKLIEDGDGDSYYIDFDTIEEKNGYVYWWQMRDYLKPSKGNKIVKTLTKGDCGISRSSGVFYIDHFALQQQLQILVLFWFSFLAEFFHFPL